MADSSKTCQKDQQVWVLQFCHGYDGPFLDCARQYAVLYKDTHIKVCTVYLTGKPSTEVEAGSASDEVIFLNFSSRQIRGLKIRAITALRKISKSRDFKFCVAHRAKPIYISLLATNLPVIGVYHAFNTHQRKMRRICASFFKSRLNIVAVSNDVRDDIRSCLPNWPERKIQTFYNRIDVDALRSNHVDRYYARDFLGISQDAWVVGNVGRLHPDKDQKTLIKSFAALVKSRPSLNALLVIAGSGRLEIKLKELAGELGVTDKVLFLGQVKNFKKYFKAFDLFVLSSDREPFGMVLLEAMAAGNQVIVSDCGGAPEVLGDYGLKFEYGNDKDLLEKILLVLDGSFDDGESLKTILSNFSDDEAIKRNREVLDSFGLYKLVE